MYAPLMEILERSGASTTLEERLYFATQAFNVSSHYDSAIFNYFNTTANLPVFKQSIKDSLPLRYGENPHQNALFYGKSEDLPVQLHGKEISYNNLLDIEAAIELISDFEETTVAIIKHNNACGCASRESLKDAWAAALAGDPVSAFGGVIITNREIDIETATEMNNLFLRW